MDPLCVNEKNKLFVPPHKLGYTQTDLKYKHDDNKGCANIWIKPYSCRKISLGSLLTLK